MAKLNKWDSRHINNLGRYARQIEAIYQSAVREATAIGATIPNFNPDKPFSFADYPATRERANKLIKSLKSGVQTVILNGIDAEWTLANNKNSELANWVFGDNVGKLTQTQYRKYFSTNDKAREAFISRKTEGLNLSDRVWNYTDQFKTEIEMGLDLGLRNGLSAEEIERDLRKYLKYPDELFRRVRDEHGQLYLSQQAKAFNPGQGVYRSSRKNALRLTRTETNMSYRTSDYIRWQQLDFVVGIEVVTSNNHQIPDICDELAGKYPKDYKFTGWHPQCRCHATTILKSPDEMAVDNERIMNGEELNSESVNSVSDVPQQFNKWITDNQGRIRQAKSLPYFIRDNEKYFPEMRITNAAVKSVKEAQAFNSVIDKSIKAAPKQVTKSTAEIKAENEAMKWLVGLNDPVMTSTYYDIKEMLPVSVRKDFNKLKSEVMKRYFKNSVDENYKIVIPSKADIQKAVKQEVIQAKQAKTPAVALETDSGNYSAERINSALNYKTKEAGYNGLIDYTSKEWLNLSPAERKALWTQTGNDYKDINAALRAGKKNKTAETIKQALSKQSLPNDMILQRGGMDGELLRFGLEPESVMNILKNGNISLSKREKMISELLTGKEGVEKGFLSTGVGTNFGGVVQYEIFVPKGTQAMYTEPFSDFGYGGKGWKWDGKIRQTSVSTENEVLINCGYKMRIRRIEIRLDKMKHAYIHIKADLY